MPPLIMTAVKTAHPISVVRGPKRCRSRANIGDSAAEAMFAEPKLKMSDTQFLGFKFQDSQDAIGKTTTFEEPFVNITDAWSKK